MYRLLIADDENIIRQGIVETFQKSISYFEVFEADNGEDVLRIMKRVKIDALIIDIKMPKMGGITVLKRLWETNSTVLTVVLTGYDEFDYAKNALEYGAIKYILKPMVPSQLLELAAELKMILDTRAEKEKELTILREDFIKNRKLQKEKLFQDILNGEQSESRIKERAKILNLKLRGPMYQIAVLGTQHYSTMTTKENNYLIDYSILLFLEEYIKTDDGTEIFQLNSNQYVFLLNLEEPDERTQIDRLYDLKQQVEKRFEVTCAAGLGSVCDELGRIRYSYSSAESIVRYLNIQNFDYVLAAEETKEGGENEEAFFDIDDFSMALMSGSENKVQMCVKRLFERAVEGKNAGTKMTGLYLCVDQMILAAYQSLLQSGGSVEEVEMNELTALEKIYQMSTLEEIKEFTETFACKVCRQISGIKTDGRNNTIRKIEQIVGEEYMKPLSMKYIADKLYLNHIYLGQIFKKETGISLNDYINKVRISKAKKLLKSANSMVYEVAEQVGFSDSQYFSTVFKKIVGVSPKEYKDM